MTSEIAVIVPVAPKNASQKATSRRSSPKKLLEERVQMFSVGRRAELVKASIELTATSAQAAIRKRRNHDDVQKKADRALKLVQTGDLSAGWLALDGAQVADGNQAFLKAVTDTRRRPAVLRAHCRNLSWNPN